MNILYYLVFEGYFSNNRLQRSLATWPHSSLYLVARLEDLAENSISRGRSIEVKSSKILDTGRFVSLIYHKIKERAPWTDSFIVDGRSNKFLINSQPATVVLVSLKPWAIIWKLLSIDVPTSIRTLQIVSNLFRLKFYLVPNDIHSLLRADRACLLNSTTQVVKYVHTSQYIGEFEMLI